MANLDGAFISNKYLGVDSLISYYKFCKRLDNLIRINLDVLSSVDTVQLILLINKMLILKNITTKQKQLSSKLSENQPLSLYEQEMVGQIQIQKDNISKFQLQCKQLTQNVQIDKSINLQNNSKLTKFIHQLIDKDFRYEQVIRLQYHLRKLILNLIQENRVFIQVWNQERVIMKQKSLIMLDFLISILQLNALIIQSQNNWYMFSQKSDICKALNCPIKFDLQILKKLITKIKFLRLKQVDNSNY